MIKFTFVFILGCLGVTVFGQSPCASPKAHEFDFWIGNWTVYQSGTSTIVGYNNITAVADGCGLNESWRSANGSSIGTSLNKYSFRKGKWQQFWIDNSGLTLELEGGFENEKMIMTGITTNQNGVPMQNKITWFKNSDGTVRQLWEQSQDEGKTWVVAFDGTYKKS
jgi:hypothetical protein